MPAIRNMKFTTSRLIPPHPFWLKYQMIQMTPHPPTSRLISGECSSHRAGVISSFDGLGGGSAPSSSSSFGSASICSPSLGCIIGPMTTMKMKTTAASRRLKGWKMVSVMGIMPISFSRKCLGVATSSGADAERPACQKVPIPRYAVATSRR